MIVKIAHNLAKFVIIQDNPCKFHSNSCKFESISLKFGIIQFQLT